MEEKIMEHLFTFLIVSLPTAIAVFIIKGWFKLVSTKLDFLIETVNSLLLKDVSQSKDIEQGKKERNELFKITSEHGKRITSLEAFKNVLETVHNKEHPHNQL